MSRHFRNRIDSPSSAVCSSDAVVSGSTSGTLVALGSLGTSKTVVSASASNTGETSILEMSQKSEMPFVVELHVKKNLLRQLP